MNNKVSAWVTAAALVLFCGVAAAAEVTLNQVTFPERNKIEIGFARDERAPEATLVAEVKYREGQADMNIRFKEMKPAILFGGDVTCYVLWAVTRDGTVENLGELWVRDDSETVEYSTGLKSFAMMVTAESHPLVSMPSDLVMFRSLAAKAKRATSEGFTFSDFATAPQIEYPSVAKVIWDRSEPLDLRQAEKAYELAIEADAGAYAASQLRRAKTTLAQARGFSNANKTKAAVDYSRRSVVLSAEALQVAKQRKEAEAVEAEIERRRAEMEALTARADQAEADAATAAVALEDAKRALAEARRSRAEADAAVLAAQGELTRIEAERTALQASMAALKSQTEALEREKVELSARLQGALSQVADTQESARGMIVSLPDILFDLNEATLKNEARVVIAKLAGILLIMPELNLRVEGHTDSTGSPDYNQRLSERRAQSVRDFLAQQGIDGRRMVAVGYGLTRPVADNSTREGRAKNRRVEIVIAEGEVAAD
jgi:outer membrane protein OmpA-like peptidoglycan-associated protein